MAKVIHAGGVDPVSMSGARGSASEFSPRMMSKASPVADTSRPQAWRVTHPATNGVLPTSSIPSPLASHINQRPSTSTSPQSRTSNSKTHLAQSPLPLLPPAPPQITSVRTSLLRRRSSFPPAALPSSTTSTFPWVEGGTVPLPDTATFEDCPALETGQGDMGGADWIPAAGSWEALLNFDEGSHQTPSQTGFTDSYEHGQAVSPGPPIFRSKSDPSSEPRPDNSVPPASISVASSSSRASFTFQAPVSPGRIAQFGSDLAWKTILSSIVEVEAVGEIEVAKVLQEVWKRGGGDAVTNQCLWPSIIMSLSLLPEHSSVPRKATPCAHAAFALQQLYNLTLRHWEPSIFSGLLASFSLQQQTTPPPHLFGTATPARETDMSQWMNITPGVDLSSLLGGSGFTPRGPNAHHDFHFEPEARRNSTVRTEGDDQARGIDEILAAMEEGQVAHERAMAQATADKDKSRPKSSSRPDEFQLPTPETDNSNSPADRAPSESRKASDHSPDSMVSPFVTASSATASIVSKIVPATTRQPHPTSVMIPNATFVPPPPMCMFFSPAFKDLKQGKVGVWKGDLDIRGRGGGKFSILIVGEEKTGHLWQSNLWTETISYPQETTPNESQGSCTSSMIPVSHLARDGFTPIAMGMVLCNDPDITAYVQMVQGLHAEGVAFHLPNPARLPLVFLPAKFESSDPLQRLGVAFMSKPGIPQSVSCPNGEKGEPKRKRRRQSAPAKTLSEAGGRRPKKESVAVLRGGIEEEEVIVE